MSDARPRLDKILTLHGQTLHEAVGQREPKSNEAQLPIKDLIQRFAGADPTDGKSRTQWLVKTYIKDKQFKLEDLGRVDAALAAFERFKRKLPLEQRELSRFKSLRGLEELVAPFVKAEERARLTRDLSSATGREKRRLEEMKARDESVIVQEGEGLPTIAVPMTEFASCWWGRGTQWCTAAEKDNAFTQYHKDAPLIVIVCPDGEKFQMHVPKEQSHVMDNTDTSEFCFMDNTDEKVGEETIQERWNEFESLLYWAVEQNGLALKHVPEDKISPELCRIVVVKNGLALQNIPEEFRTPELCRIAIEQNGRALIHVPKNKKTPQLCRLAVEQNGVSLCSVPEKYITPELCQLAVEQDGRALVDVPKELRTPELCRIAIEQNGEALKFLPKDNRSVELCHLAVVQNGQALYNVPEEYKTEELCLLAIKQNGLAIINVHKKYQTPELWRMAIEQDGEVLKFLPKEKITPELCRLAVEQNGEALYHVSENKITLELCRIAIVKDGLALVNVPEEMRTPELCWLAVEQNGEALAYVPEKYKTLELCRLAVEHNGLAIHNVPAELKTPEFMDLIPPVQPKWHPDILKELCAHFQSLQNFKTNLNDDSAEINPMY
jgi:hypothetical protein